jgi:hypothetical protein
MEGRLMPIESNEPSAAAWSESINGLAGRVRVEFEDLQPGLRHAVYIELMNHGPEPVSVFNQPAIHAVLFDSTLQPVGTSGLAVSGPMARPAWAVIPPGAYVGLRVDVQTAGVPTRQHGMALLAVDAKGWEIKPGRYVLAVSAAFADRIDGPENRWVGELAFPRIEIVLTAQMLAEGH